MANIGVIALSGINSQCVIKRFQRGEIDLTQTFQLLSSKNTATKQQSSENIHSKKEINSIKELENLVGLHNVKELIKKHIDFLQVQQLRKNYQLINKSLSMHMIFRGNPGTGKTTVARLVGNIFRETGLLMKGQFVEAERADLVGEYIGHTARKTKEFINKALGGILFIDEAYSLARGGRKDFGREAIDTLVKGVEDHREELVVILAGYKQEMSAFIHSNPGLDSRFSLKINFPDYTLDELVQIAEMMFKKREYILTRNSKYYMYKVLNKIRKNQKTQSNNARMVRNLVENTIRNQARRIIKNRSKISRQKLMTIKKTDLPRGADNKNDRLSDSWHAQCR